MFFRGVGVYKVRPLPEVGDGVVFIPSPGSKRSRLPCILCIIDAIWPWSAAMDSILSCIEPNVDAVST